MSLEEALVREHAAFDATLRRLPLEPQPQVSSDEVVARLIRGERATKRLGTRTAQHLAMVLGAHPEASLVHAVRLLDLSSLPALENRWLCELLLATFARHHGAIDAIAFERALLDEHLDPDGVVSVVLEFSESFEPRSCLALLEGHGDAVAAAIDDRTYSWQPERRRHALVRLLVEVIPSPGLSAALVPYVLTAPRDVAAPLRHALRGVPTEVLAGYLASRDHPTRRAAAEWLSERRASDAIPALRAALNTEKQEATYAAIVGALEACGAPAVLDEKTLEKQAQKALAKGWPEELAFLARDTLPRLRWKSGGELPRAIAEGWLVAAHKAKEVAPSPIVVVLAPRLATEDRHAFARAVLERFIAWDTRIPTELSEQAEHFLALALAGWAKGQTREQLLSRPDAKNKGLPQSSAVKDKGVLGVVAALGGGDLVPILASFVTTHRGFRASQSRAMLTVLAFLEAPSATQSLLRFASRFRTPGIQKEAALLADELAARRGWTLAELADRTVPTAGLDDDGSLTLVYGRPEGEAVIETRRFVARLGEGDELLLEDADGQRLRALPDARKDEDEALVQGEKKRFSTARKELKALFSAQTERLFEAMVGERRWPLSDFRTYFLDHPVLGRLVRRAIFTAHREDALVTFRPAGDGSFVDVEHQAVELDDDMKIGLAHSAHSTPAIDTAWREHLADYQLVPLFPQLDRAAIPVDRIEGHLILPPTTGPVLAVQLRSRAKRAGLAEQRGDGGYINTFARALPTLDRTLVLTTEGIAPDAPKDAKVVVTGLSVHPASRDTTGLPGALPIASLPAPLRDEAWCMLVSLVT